MESPLNPRRGNLKIFLGAVSGVGKSFTMLAEARELAAAGTDVAVGWVEAHQLPDIEALLYGYERLPTRTVQLDGQATPEFDVDAALARAPSLILIDDLAHANPPGLRHPKRWQDVEELLAAGIDVYTTVNVGQLESLQDIVAQITGIRFAETLPDEVFSRADEVELVDCPPQELLHRLADGKVHVLPQLAELFSESNLIALREMALRQAADRVDAQIQGYRDQHRINTAWHVRERILLCLGATPGAEPLVRAGRRLAAALRAEWIVVHVETPELMQLTQVQRDNLVNTLRLAEQLGANTATLVGDNAAEIIVAYAKERNVTRIMVGQPRRRPRLTLSVTDQIVRLAGDIDVHIVNAQSARTLPTNPFFDRSRQYFQVPKESIPHTRRFGVYTIAALVTLALNGLAWPLLAWIDAPGLAMLDIVAILLIASRFGGRPALLSAVVGTICFMRLMPPGWVALGLIPVALFTGNLTAMVRRRALDAAARERRTAALYAMSREFVAACGRQSIVAIAVRHVGDFFDSQAVILLPNAEGKLVYPKEQSVSGSLHGADLTVAQWVFERNSRAGLGTDTNPDREICYLPLAGSIGVFGVLALLPIDPVRARLREQQQLLSAFADQIAMALERVELAKQGQAAALKAESERFRNTLLSANSHDLRTPLSAIVGSSSMLLQDTELSAAARRNLSGAIYEESVRMTELIANVLDMARLEAGAVKLNRQWQPLEEIVGAVLASLRARLAQHTVKIALPADLPLALVDGILIERVLCNLLENAVKYTPRTSRIEIGGHADSEGIVVSVSDNGPGLPAGMEERVFDKFYRADPESGQVGIGLGLTICRAIVEAHGGRIWAERLAVGATFRFRLPFVGTTPQIEPELEVPLHNE